MVDEVKYMRQIIKEERGQSMLEMALVLPLLLALVFGIIEFGNVYSTKIEMNNLARQAVRTAVVSDVDKFDTVAGEIQAYARADLGMKTATVKIEPSGSSDVIATVEYAVPLITGQVIGTKPIATVSKATMKKE